MSKLKIFVYFGNYIFKKQKKPRMFLDRAVSKFPPLYISYSQGNIFQHFYNTVLNSILEGLKNTSQETRVETNIEHPSKI